MHKRTPPVFWLLSLLTLCAAFPSCNQPVETDHAQVGEAVKSLQPLPFDHVYLIDTAQSRISWIGSRVTGRHNGIIPFRQGQVRLRENAVVGGTIVLDMPALRATDKRIDQANREKLSRHLKSVDFFDTERYPDATFEIVAVKPVAATARPAGSAGSEEGRIQNPTHSITGNLTIKSRTRSITFPARLVVEGEELRAQANFNIDRTHWGLTYGSDESLGNKTIHPIVNVGLAVVAKPQQTTL